MPTASYYAILGVPMGASIDHIKDSYRLLTRKSLITEIAYRTLTAPETRREYDASLLGEPSQTSEDNGDWGSRGRERCSCGRILEIDDDWYCEECAGTLEYWVVFDLHGGYVIHDDQMPFVTGEDGESYWEVPFGSLYGPFPKHEAKDVLAEKNRLRSTR